MFPLAGKDFPQSSEELATAIHDALEEVLSFPKENNAVSVEGGKYPAVKQVKVDLSNATVDTKEPPPPPKPKGKRQEGITVEKLDVLGHPIKYQDSKADLSLNARNVSFDFAHDAGGKPMLVLKDAQGGHVEVKIGKDDIQSLLKAVASEAAKSQKVTIQDMQVNLDSQGPRSIAADVRVKAKKMAMSGVLTIRGKLDIDDNLVATLSDLSVKGEGVVGSMAAGFLQGKLKHAEGRKVPLMAFSLGDVSLRDLKISTAKGLQVSAEFGKK